MVLIDQLWDEVIAGPQPENGLGKLRKLYTKTGGEAGSSSSSSKYQRSLSMPTSGGPGTPTTPGTPGTPKNLSPSAKKENVWWGVFHPGANQATKHIGGEMFDNAAPNSPTVYDWLYSDKTRSKHR